MTHNKLLGAINKDTGKYTPPRFAIKNNKYKCPECERDLIFRQGKIKVPLNIFYLYINFFKLFKS